MSKTKPVFLTRIPRVQMVRPVLTWKPFPQPTRLVDGVLEGGGTLGAAYAGSLRFMQESGLWFRRIAGNSAGAITACLIAAGYNAQEIEWLMSNFTNRPSRPATLPAGLDPIDFMDFLDLPTLNSISAVSIKRTVLWRALKGQAIDEVLKTEIPLIPSRATVVQDIIDGLKNIPAIGAVVTGPVENVIRTMLNALFPFLPATRKPRLSDYSLFDETAGLRTQFANTVWTASAMNNPLLILSTQLLHEGSLFEGKVFQDTIGRLLAAKVNGNPNTTVQFNQLPIPLAVIGCNYATGAMEVYSSAKNPTMIVADAVRRSMSLPLVFEPVGLNKTIIDGGVISNFPLWLYTPSGDQYWPANSIDPTRAKVGLSLDETKPAPQGWNASPAKFALAGTPPPHVAMMEVLIPILIAKLKDSGFYVPSASYGDVELAADLRAWKLLEVLVGWLSIDKEVASREVIVKGLMSAMPYFDVVIPLLGFHGFDFDVNNDRDDLQAIAERGFLAARDALGGPAYNQSAALLNNPAALRNPYA